MAMPGIMGGEFVMKFTENQLERYSRHILLEDVGVEGQEKIIESRVLIIGGADSISRGLPFTSQPQV